MAQIVAAGAGAPSGVARFLRWPGCAQQCRHRLEPCSPSISDERD